MHKILESELLSADVVLYIKYKINANISYSADAITWESFVYILMSTVPAPFLQSNSCNFIMYGHKNNG